MSVTYKGTTLKLHKELKHGNCVVVLKRDNSFMEINGFYEANMDYLQFESKPSDLILGFIQN